MQGSFQKLIWRLPGFAWLVLSYCQGALKDQYYQIKEI